MEPDASMPVSPISQDIQGAPATPVRPESTIECRRYDPIGKPPHYRRIPDVPTFPRPPAPEVHPVRTNPTWLGVGRPPRKPGRTVVVDRIPTRQKVVFLTIDDGSSRDPRTEALLRRADVPVTVFLVGTVQRCETSFFRQLQRMGARMENHTEYHPEMPQRSLAGQRREICPAQARYQKAFGHRPGFFRPPYGLFNANTLTAMNSCQIPYLVLWSISVSNRNRISYLHSQDRKIQPGDIILLHFQNDFVESYAKILQQIKEAGLTPALLEDYLR
jgi:peptidoglycan/xylan/chitin deacetylase (PgdA/CDA1 family)